MGSTNVAVPFTIVTDACTEFLATDTMVVKFSRVKLRRAIAHICHIVATADVIIVIIIFVVVVVVVIILILIVITTPAAFYRCIFTTIFVIHACVIILKEQFADGSLERFTTGTATIFKHHSIFAKVFGSEVDVFEEHGSLQAI